MGPVSRSKTMLAVSSAPSAATKPENSRREHHANEDADADTPMADAPAIDTQGQSSTAQEAKKRKRKEKEAHILHQTTFRKPAWSYFHLALVTPGTAAQPPSAQTAPSSSSSPDIDALTVSTLLLQPLTAYLGTTGAALPVDILHTQGRSAYIRLSRQDAKALRASLSGWIGGCDAGSVPGVEDGGRVRVAWRVVSEGGSLGFLRGSGEEVFGDNGAAY